MGGSSKGGGSVDPSPSEILQYKIGKQLWEETTPMRLMLESQFGGALGGGALPEMYSPVYAAGKQGIESQYGQARENIMGATPRGGALTDALSNLEFARAGDLGNLQAGLNQDIFNKIYGMTLQAPQTSIAGLGSAAGAYGTRQAAEMASKSNAKAGKGGLARGLGYGVGRIFE